MNKALWKRRLAWMLLSWLAPALGIQAVTDMSEMVADSRPQAFDQANASASLRAPAVNAQAELQGAESQVAARSTEKSPHESPTETSTEAATGTADKQATRAASKSPAWHRAAEQFLELGGRAQHGIGRSQQLDEAIGFYCAAAALGSAEASYRLGDIYSRTLTGHRDEPLSALWFHQALHQGSHAAQGRLAIWDLSDLDQDDKPPCVMSAAMLDRTLAKAPRMAPSAASGEDPMTVDGDAAAGLAITSPPTDQQQPQGASTDHPPVRWIAWAGQHGAGVAKGSESPTLDPSRYRTDPRRDQIRQLVERLAPEFNLSPALVLAVIQTESNFDPSAVSPKEAQGLMQLIPDTAERFSVRDPFDPLENLRGGMAYLRWLLDQFDGDLQLALAGYNAGEQAVERHQGVPPYKETQDYVRKVLSLLAPETVALISE